MEGRWQVKGGKVADLYRGKAAVYRGKVAVYRGKAAVYRGKNAGNWRECDR